MYFNVVPKDDVPCQVLLNNNIKSRITDDSWIDLSKTRHFSLLPNLSYFVGASFPSRGWRTIRKRRSCCPAEPSETQVATLLNLAARSGMRPAPRWRITASFSGCPPAAGICSRCANVTCWRSPLSISRPSTRACWPIHYRPVDNVAGVREPDLWQKAQRRLTGDWTPASLDADRYFSRPAAPGGGFISYRSPWSPPGWWWWRWPAMMISWRD